MSPLRGLMILTISIYRYFAPRGLDDSYPLHSTDISPLRGSCTEMKSELNYRRDLNSNINLLVGLKCVTNQPACPQRGEDINTKQAGLAQTGRFVTRDCILNFPLSTFPEGTASPPLSTLHSPFFTFSNYFEFDR